jgi:hypothetical protein
MGRLIPETVFTDMNLNIGQTYKIKIVEGTEEKLEKVETEKGNVTKKFKIIMIREAKLIQQTKYFFVFEYQSKSGEMLRATITKFDYYKEPDLIKEA